MNRDVDYVQLDSSDQNSNQSSTECSNYDSFEQGLSDQNRPKGEQFRMSGNEAGTFPNLFQSTFCASSEEQKTSVDSISGKDYYLLLTNYVFLIKKEMSLRV